MKPVSAGDIIQSQETRKMQAMFLVIVFSILLVSADAVDLGGTCSTATDCTDTTDNSDCISSVCKCASGYAQSGSTCIQVGEACQADNICPDPLVCESSKCKIKAGETCTDTADCVSQSTCDSNSDKCKCNSGYTAGWTDLCIADGAVGGACLPDSKCTASTSVCESSTCKVKAEKPCTAPTYCVSQSTCSDGKCTCGTGYTAGWTGMCIVNGAVGGACLSDSTCTASTSVCESAVCKIKAGVTCTDTNECVSQSTCDSDSDKCTCNNGYTAGWTDLCIADGAVGGVCLSGSTCTASTSVCESAVCKIKAGETCTDTKECVSQSTCDSDKCACATDYPKTPAGLCIADGAVGGACLSDSTCTDSTSVCELSTCKIKAGETCSATIECVSQSTCDSEECTCNSGYTETSTGLCNGVAPQSMSSWLLTGSSIMILLTWSLP